VPPTRVLLLLDRPADTFLGKRANADVMLVKPVDPSTLRRTVDSLLAVGSPADPTGEPEPAAR
jgi:hypothetical protein